MTGRNGAKLATLSQKKSYDEKGFGFSQKSGTLKVNIFETTSLANSFRVFTSSKNNFKKLSFNIAYFLGEVFSRKLVKKKKSGKKKVVLKFL